MAKFDMGEFAKTLAQPVSESGTGREQIEYIDVDLLDSDPGNFYGLCDLDDLAANIATIGLQQPIRVRVGKGGHVVIVSGHRRAAAIRKLVAEGRTDLRDVPCIRESDDASPALRELRLIYANSSTRDLTAAELSHQAEKVRELLYQLQEEGFDFPGRMRDHVAEACKISKSKLARLEKIQKGLASCYRDAWEAGALPEDTADALAGLSEEVQERIKRVCPKKAPTANAIREMGERLGSNSYGYYAAAFRCPDAGACTHQDKLFRHDLTCSSWERCGGQRCCLTCSAGGKHSPSGWGGRMCPDMCAAAKAAFEKAKARAEAKAEREKQSERSAVMTKAQAVAQRIVRAADAAGLAGDAKVVGSYGGGFSIDVLRGISRGDVPDGARNVDLNDLTPWRTTELVKNAKTLRCSVDYLLGLTDDINSTAAVSGQVALAAWMPGGTTPAEPCDVVAEFDLSGDGKVVSRTLCRWDGEVFRFGKGKDKIEVRVVRWLALPEVEKEDGSDD